MPETEESEWEFRSRPVTLAELRELAHEGVFYHRKRSSKYRSFLEDFKNGPDLAREAAGLTESQVSQLTAAIPKVFGTGKVTTKTLNVTGEGKDQRIDLLMVKLKPETEQILFTTKIHSGGRSRTTMVESEDSR